MSIRAILISIFGTALSISAIAQSDSSSFSLDLLRTPSNPAFNIMGISPSEIAQPGDPTDVLVSFQNASENFNSIPTDYALSFAPAWVFGGDKIDLKDYESNRLWDNIKQSALISLAIHQAQQTDSVTSTQLGLGLSFSLIRGKLVSNRQDLFENGKEKYYAVLSRALMTMEERTKRALASDSLYQRIHKRVKLLLEAARNDFLNESGENELIILTDSLSKMETRTMRVVELTLDRPENQSEVEREKTGALAELKNIAETTRFYRTGFLLNFGSGLAIDFPNQIVENKKLIRWGAWLTASRDLADSPWTFLAVSRIQKNNDFPFINEEGLLQYAENWHFDMGAKLVYQKGKFDISAEWMRRAVMEDEFLENSSKYILNFNYAIFPNKLLSFAVGKDFENNRLKEGNLIAVLDLALGFGSKRPVLEAKE